MKQFNKGDLVVLELINATTYKQIPYLDVEGVRRFYSGERGIIVNDGLLIQEEWKSLGDYYDYEVMFADGIIEPFESWNLKRVEE